MSRTKSSRVTLAFLLCAPALFAGACGGGDYGGPPADGGPKVTATPDEFLDPPRSCAFDCIDGCEPKGYECPALGAWDALPHADSCGNFDGTFPPIVGKCTASAPTGEAVKKTGVDPGDPLTTILPSGYRVRAAGKTSVFADLHGQFPTNVVAVPGTDLVVVVDGGVQEQSVRLVDTTKIGEPDPVVGREKFLGDTAVNYGAVVIASATTTRLYVSGGPGSLLYAFTIDVAGKKLVRTAADDIKIDRPASKPAGGGLGGGYLVSGLAVSNDGKRIFAGTGGATTGTTPVLVIDADPASATYKSVLQSIDVHTREVFTVTVHPADTESRYVYASEWDGARVDVIDTKDGSVRSIDVAGGPEAFAQLGTRYLAVVDSAGDAISVIDTLPTTGAEVLRVPVVDGSKRGWAPSGLVFDPAKKRLYVTLAGLDAVAAYDVDLPDGAPPTVVPSGMLPTEWWPTAAALRGDGGLVVINGKGRGTGPNASFFGPGDGPIVSQMRGSIQLVDAPDAATLTAGKAAVDKMTHVEQLDGASKIDCGGAPYDFPIPETTDKGPSLRIKHVVFLLKENKTFDGVFGDVPGVDGDPALVMAPGKMAIFDNERKMAGTFTNFDNYYTSAEQSIQGHVWDTSGRTTEYTERTWITTWGRAYRGLPAQAIIRTEEGSMFTWLQKENVFFDAMGEITGLAPDDGRTPKNCCSDNRYPGPFYAPSLPDTEKSCYIAARARVTCDLKAMTYTVQPNDHTEGLTAGAATPITMIAVGDEAVGILLEGLSKSPFWNETLVIVSEDDPQDGGDHVDLHRTPMYMASPWVKKGYVAKGHYDISSIHKLIAHIFGKPYLNEEVARAALPLEAFTSTPDYAPFDRAPRSVPVACNPETGKGATTAAMSGWNFSVPDEAPGIAAQLWEYFHDGAAPPPGFGEGDDDDD